MTNPSISNTVIKNNASDNVGGGIASFFSGLILSNVTLTGNKAGSVGGGIGTWRSDLTIDSSNFINNEAMQSGGGLFFNCGDTMTFTYQLNLTNSNFTNNAAVGSEGAIRAQQADSARVNVLVDKCLFTENVAPSISALRFKGDYLNFIFRNSIITNNETKNQASGAMFVRCKGAVSNCLFASNKVDTVGEFYNLGSVVVWDGAKVDFMHSTFTDNSASYGAGLFVGYGGSATATNCIFWNNSTSQIALYTLDGQGGTLIVNYSDIQGGYNSVNILDSLSTLTWGDGNIDADPIFETLGNGDYHLQDISPCIGAAIDAIEINGIVCYCPPTDIEYNPRPNPAGSMPDMGAYESLLAHPVGVEENVTGYPTEYALYQNYPNPFNPTTTIKYSIPKLSFVTIKIYDVLGSEVAALVNEEKPAGTYELNWNAAHLPSGVYFYRLQAGSFIQTRKMILLK